MAVIIDRGSPAGAISVRKITANASVAPGDEVWVTASSPLVLTAVHVPAGQHARIKLTTASTSTVTVIPAAGLIDGATSLLLSTPGQAIELSSDSSNFVVF